MSFWSAAHYLLAFLAKIVIVLIFWFLADHQKLEREARICRLLKHPNIGKAHFGVYATCRVVSPR